VQRLWWLNLIRGIVALVVGILILGWPSVGDTMFVNFLAFKWIDDPAMGSFLASEKRIVAGRGNCRHRRRSSTLASLLVSALP